MTHSSSDSSALSHTRFHLPLWAALTVPLIVLMMAAISLTAYLSLRNSEHVVRDIAGQLLDEITERIDVHLDAFLRTAHRINQHNADMIQSGLLDTADQDTLRHYLWQQVQVYDNVTSIYFGNAQGGLTVGGREGADGSLYVMFSENFAAGRLFKYATDDTGTPTDLLADIPTYDARTRPWYVGAVERGGPNWSEPYVLSTGQDLAIAASRPVYSASGELLGVASVDVFFTHVNDFLHGLAIGQTGQAYIVEHSGLLVATSTGAALFTNDGAAPRQRITAADSDDPVIAATAAYLVEQFEGFPHEEILLRVKVNGAPIYLRAAPYHDARGLDWMIVIAVPERDFLARIDSHNRVTVLLTVLALALAIIVGTVIARRVLRPITRLNAAAAALAQSDWSQQVPVRGPREIRQLGQTFNLMARQLHELFTHLEERVQARSAEVIASEARYRAIVEDQTELICRFTLDNRLTFVNGAYCRYFNLARDDLIGHSYMPRILEADQADVAEKLATLSRDHAVVTIEHRVFKPDPASDTEHLRWMQWANRILFDEPENRVEIQAVGRDITEQKQLALTLQKALDRETELGQLKTQFISTVSHEFRTPLSVILNASELLERYPDRLTPEKRAELFSRITAQIGRMTALLDDVFTINQAPHGQPRLTPEIVDLVALCEAAVEQIRTLDGHDVTFACSASEGCRRVNADAGLLRLIMVNLISNAAKYSPPGGTVTITLACTPEELQFVVHDAGIGIPREAHAQIFAPFYRAENVGIQPGTGLGLAIVKQSVDQHGGTISFESEEGSGSTFTVRLPHMEEQYGQGPGD